jgi:trimeric autotransporter adhesin
MMQTRAQVFVFGALSLLSLLAMEQGALADSVETAGVLNATGGVRFPDGNVQTSACTGCAGGILSISLGGTGGNTASAARTNLAVPGLITPNTFTADQTIQADLTIGYNLYLPSTTASSGIIYSGSYTLMHNYGSQNFFAGNGAGNLTMTGEGNTAIGHMALAFNTSGTANMALGRGALLSNTTGSGNTAISYNALSFNSSGNNNTAIGDGALNNNDNASNNTSIGFFSLYYQSYNGGGANSWNSDNTAIGYQAMYSNQPSSTSNGIQNTAIGSKAMYSNTTGYGNTATGFNALYANTTASGNTALGYQALFTQSFSKGNFPWDSNNTAVGFKALFSNQPTYFGNGNRNTAVGAYAMSSNTDAYANTAIGFNALNGNTIGFANTAIGAEALYVSTGSDNTAIGTEALFINATGAGNTAVGQATLDTNQVGSFNTALGWLADVGSSNLTNATAIGANAVVSQSNSLVLGSIIGINGANSSTSVGIGTSAPTATLDVVGNLKVSGGIAGKINVSEGIWLYDNNIYLRWETNHGLGWYGDGKPFASVALDGPALFGWGGGALGTTNGGQKIIVKWDPNGVDVYGNLRPHALGVGSTPVCLDGNGAISNCSSDARMKKDVITLSDRIDVLEALSKLRGVMFSWDRTNPKATNMPAGEEMGMIAQEVEEVFPQIVHTDSGGYKSLDYPKLVAFLIEVNKSQQNEINKLNAMMEEFNRRLSALEGSR